MTLVHSLNSEMCAFESSRLLRVVLRQLDGVRAPRLEKLEAGLAMHLFGLWTPCLAN